MSMSNQTDNDQETKVDQTLGSLISASLSYQGLQNVLPTYVGVFLSTCCYFPTGEVFPICMGMALAVLP